MSEAPRSNAKRWVRDSRRFFRDGLPVKPARHGTRTSGHSTSLPAAAPPSTLPIEAIQPNPMQPRMVFQPERLEELAASIRANGIIQPLIVRRHEDTVSTCGWRAPLASCQTRWTERSTGGYSRNSRSSLLEIALIENIQREDLNAIETARAFERLGRDLGLSQEEIGRRTGKDRTSIANALRLLKLPAEVQLLLAEHRLSMGHARAILGLPTAEQQIEVAEKASAQGLSVRQVEALVQN